MKLVLTTIGIPLVLLVTACNKTEQPITSTAKATSEMEVDVEVVEGEIIIMVNGEEKVVDLGDVMGDFDFENMDGEMSIAVMAMADEEGRHPMHMMKMMGGGQSGPPEGMEEMHGRMIQMHSDQGRTGHGEWRGEYPHGEREGSEVREFIQELRVLSEVSSHLNNNANIAMMGIHMIRDNLEGELRRYALETIVEESNPGPERNAALIILIQDYQEEGDIELAADLMIDLTMSNSNGLWLRNQNEDED